MKGLNGKVSDLEKAAAQRKAKLDENSAFLQFNWKADVVESWIGKRHSNVGLSENPAEPVSWPREPGPRRHPALGQHEGQQNEGPRMMKAAVDVTTQRAADRVRTGPSRQVQGAVSLVEKELG